MWRPYKEFCNKWVGKCVDYDKAYKYQCVDLIKQYADECLWMWKIGAIWNANKVPSWSFWKKFTQFKGTNNLMQWDIIIRTSWTYWHIAIVDHVFAWKVYVLEQNGSGKNSWDWKWANAIRVHPYDFSFFQVVLRNEDIVKNYNLEMEYVDEKIKEREQILKDTKEYKDTLYYRK